MDFDDPPDPPREKKQATQVVARLASSLSVVINKKIHQRHNPLNAVGVWFELSFRLNTIFLPLPEQDTGQPESGERPFQCQRLLGTRLSSQCVPFIGGSILFFCGEWDFFSVHRRVFSPERGSVYAAAVGRFRLFLLGHRRALLMLAASPLAVLDVPRQGPSLK